MAQSCTAVRLRRHGAALSVLCGFAGLAWSASGHAGSSLADAHAADSSQAAVAGQARDFDIPSQPLGDALSQYGIVSDQPAIFMSDLLNGRTSSPVRGRYSAEAALRLLLEGTGLTIEKITSSIGDSFLLKEQSGPAWEAPALARFFSSGDYAGLIQNRILAALCADKRTAPGGYRALFRFQLNAAGHIQDASLLSSSDDRVRDAALLEVLRGVQVPVPVQAPLPAALTEQALTMRLRRADPHAASPCRREGAS